MNSSRLQVALKAAICLALAFFAIAIPRLYAKGSQSTTGTWSATGISMGYCTATRSNDGCTDDLDPTHHCVTVAPNWYHDAKTLAYPCLGHPADLCCDVTIPSGDSDPGWTYSNQTVTHTTTVTIP